MARFAGIKGNRICVVSSEPIINPELQMIQLPDQFDQLSSNEVIAYSNVKNGEIKCKLLKKPVEQMRVAFITNWKEMCGIASYAECLLPEIAKGVADFKLFIEHNDNPTSNLYQFGDRVIDDDKISICWKRGESLQELVNEIKNFSPDLIIINHEFGIFPNARHWLSCLTQLSDYRIITIMHSVFHHYDKSIYEIPLSEIIVHLEGAKNCLLNEKQIHTKIHVIAHGCYNKLEDQSKLWDNYKSRHTFITQGFGFKYKSFESSIRATALLKDKYPDIYFTALFSESLHNKLLHQTYYNELIDLVEELKLEENVGIVRGFLPDNLVNCYLRSNLIAVFPYQTIKGHEVFGSSGAVRTAFSAGLPVISSSINHFIDVPTIKANLPEEIAEQLDRLFSDKESVKTQVEKQNQFIFDNSWAKVAQQYLQVFKS